MTGQPSSRPGRDKVSLAVSVITTLVVIFWAAVNIISSLFEVAHGRPLATTLTSGVAVMQAVFTAIVIIGYVTAVKRVTSPARQLLAGLAIVVQVVLTVAAFALIDTTVTGGPGVSDLVWVVVIGAVTAGPLTYFGLRDMQHSTR